MLGCGAVPILRRPWAKCGFSVSVGVEDLMASRAKAKGRKPAAKAKPRKAVKKKVAAAKRRPASKAASKKAPKKKASAKKAPAKKTARPKKAAANAKKPAAKKARAAASKKSKPKAPPKKAAPKAKSSVGKKATAEAAPPKKKAAGKATPKAPKKSAAELKAEAAKEAKLAAAERAKLAEEERRKRALLHKRAKVSKNYQPTEKEPFMNAKQLAYFKNKLLDWRDELLRESTQTLAHLQESSLAEPDIADRASAESDRSLELRTRDRERKLISKIDEALGRIVDGSYGYCEETDEPIGLKRLEARPIATLSIEAQERHERRERVYRDE